MRAQLNISQMNQVINPLMDVKKLRDLSSSFKRHTIRRFLRPMSFDPNQQMYGHSAQQAKLRSNIADYFYVYTRQVIPKIEEKIELQLLEKFKDRIGNEMEKKEVIQAYYNRKDNLAKILETDEIASPEKREDTMTIKNSELQRIVMNVEGDGLSFHTFEDIGKYTVFPERHWRRMHPSKFFGQYEKDEFGRNKTFGIMVREEGLRITNELSRLTLPHERNVDYQKFINFPNSEVKSEIIKDDSKFVAIQQDFSCDLLDYINAQENEYKLSLKKLFQSPAVFDGLVSILVQELRKKPIRYHLCIKEARMNVIDQMVRVFNQTMIDKNLNPQSLGEIIENVKLITLNLDKKYLGSQHELQKNEVHQYKLYMGAYHKICYGLWRPEEMRRVSLEHFKGNNSGCMLWGRRGSGKSQILSYVNAWAHENQWMVVTIPNCEMFTNGQENIFRAQNGLYLQNALAQDFLFDFRTQNEMLLRQTDVDMSIYGKYDITGVKDGDPEPCPRLWDESRQTWTDSWKENLYDFEIKFLQQKYDEMNTRCAEKLPDPKKLIDIIDLGIMDPELATSCFGEILEQLYHTNKFHVLWAMDGYNDWLKPSEYLSFRYENSRALRGRIPPHDIALVRLLMKFDGHMARNGFKLLSTTHYRQFNHKFTPDMINFPNGYHAQVENLALNDFRNMLLYKHFTGWMPDYLKEWEVESYYMETQGNWHAFHDSFNAAVDQRFKTLHDIIRTKRGTLTAEDDESVIVKNVFKEIPVFKDIPSTFKLELANALEALTFNTHDIIFDQRETSHFYILLQGEALIIQSEKQLQILQKTQFSVSQTPKQETIEPVEDPMLDLNMVRIRKATIVGPRDMALIQKSQAQSNDITWPISRAGESNKNGTTPEAEQEPAWKKNEDVKSIGIGDCFGQYYSLTGAKWRPSFVMAIRDDTLILKAQVAKIDSMLNKINSSEQHKQLLQFLNNTIFGFDRISAAARDKVARCFVEKQFYPGQKLIREGSSHTSAYIIKEGDCVLMSRQSPTDIQFDDQGNPIAKVVRGLDALNEDKKKRGYMSKTTNSFQFGVKGKGQWVGEDILILNDPFYFSVIAVGRVVVLEISKSDMLSKLPSQFIKYLEKSSQKRKEWVLQRMKAIKTTVKAVIKQGEDDLPFDDPIVKKGKNGLPQVKALSLSESKGNRDNRMKRTLNMKVNQDISIDASASDIRLPSLVNPRDAKLMETFSRKSIGNSPGEEQTKTLNHSQSRSISPLRVKISAKFQSSKDVQTQMLSQLNQRIDIKHIQRYKEESEIKDTRSKSELGLIRMSFNTSQFGDSNYQPVLAGHRSRHSIANLSQFEGSEAGETATRNHSVVSNFNQNQSERRIPLLNAKTLKPLFGNRRRTQLIPVFHQRNPMKTRNMVANSIHAAKIHSQLMDQYYSQTDISYPESRHPGLANNHSDTQDDYQYQSQQILKPSVYQFSINHDQDSAYGSSSSPIKLNSQLRGLHKLDSKLQKEAKKKYQSFMMGQGRVVNELDKKLISEQQPESNILEESNPYAYEGQEGETEDPSRENTPNPWDQYRRRMQKKARMMEGMSKMSNYETEEKVKSALSYLNYDI